MWTVRPYIQEKKFSLANFLYTNFYLCSADKSNEYNSARNDRKRNKVILIEFNKEKDLLDHPECFWRLDRHENLERGGEDPAAYYYIYNNFYDEPLYAASFFITFFGKRQALLWKNSPDSEQFKWHINCP
jgi:hypothetical protein